MKERDPSGMASSFARDYVELPIPTRIQENHALKAVFDALVSAGVDQTTLSASLYTLCLPCIDRRGEFSAGNKRNPWPGITMTKRQLKGLPQRIRTMATEIKRLNTAPLFDPAHWGPPSDSAENRAFLEFLAGMHTRLPSFLDTYAAYLDRRLAELGQFGKTKFSLAKAIRMELSESVRRATGNYYDEKLASLISAVTGEADLTGDDLKKQRERNPRLRKKTP